MADIGHQIKQARRERGLSQEELGRAVGTTKSTISKYELGHREPSFEQLRRIADVLGRSAAELMGLVELTDECGIYVDTNDEIYIEAIKPYLSDLEPLSGKEDALRTLLNEMGYNILKARGKYFFSYKDGGAEISKDDLSELFSCAQNGLKIAAKALELKLLQESLDPRYRAETAPQSPPAPQKGKDTTPPPDAPETAPEGE